MPRIPTPLTWKRRNLAVLEDLGMVDRLTAADEIEAQLGAWRGEKGE